MENRPETAVEAAAQVASAAMQADTAPAGGYEHRTGTCAFCGQQHMLGAAVETKAEADLAATSLCRCAAGLAYRQQEQASARIAAMFPELPATLTDFLLTVSGLIREEQLYSGTSIKVAPNVTARFKLRDGAVVISRSEKMEYQSSI